MHCLVTDALTDEVLIDADFPKSGKLENKNAVGVHLQGGQSVAAQVYGPIYHGIKVWVAPRSRVYDWEPAGDSVFVQWTDKSNSREPERKVEIVHTVERPLPGGGIGRFVVAVG